jgi:hypothetical protein
MVARVRRVVQPMPTVCVGPAGRGHGQLCLGHHGIWPTHQYVLVMSMLGLFEGCRLGPGGRFCLVSGRLVWTGGLWCAGGGLLAWLGEPGQGVELNWCLPLDRDQGGDAAEAAQRC